MRIIAGKYRRRSLKVPRKGEIRPTSDRVREATFNILMARFDLEGASVLDLFAGTGALGLEALSRGAARVTFVESDPDVLRCCTSNAASLDALDSCTFLSLDVIAFLNRPTENPFDLILADPPYRYGVVSDLPELVIPVLDSRGLFVLEHDRKLDFQTHDRLVTTRRYGRTGVSIFTVEARNA